MEKKDILGVSRHITELKTQIQQAANNDETVLITGPTGTGKELVANNIHMLSTRKNKPYVTVNCGGIQASLFESEVFGHAKGAYTGATEPRKGRIASAEGGTLFLDEIGDLKGDQQTVLLRFLNDKHYSPVGSDLDKKADVRIISATNRPLHQEATTGKFRSDLYARLSQTIIETEPLKNRPEDVVMLLNFKNTKTDPKAKVLLYSYDWPGNVRELENLAVKNYPDIRKYLIKEASARIGQEITNDEPSFEFWFDMADKKVMLDKSHDILRAIEFVKILELDYKKLIHAYEILLLKSVGLSNDKIADALHIGRAKLSQFKEIFGLTLSDIKINNFSDFLQNIEIRSAFLK